MAAPFPAIISKLNLPPRLRSTNLDGIGGSSLTVSAGRPILIRDSTITFRPHLRIKGTASSATRSRRSPTRSLGIPGENERRPLPKSSEPFGTQGFSDIHQKAANRLPRGRSGADPLFRTVIGRFIRLEQRDGSLCR